MDWEIYSSMYDGNNQQEVWNLCHRITNNKWQIWFQLRMDSKKRIFIQTSRHGYQSPLGLSTKVDTPYMPDRLIDNLLKPEAKSFSRTMEQNQRQQPDNFG